MEWIEWLLSREFRQFLFDNNLFFPLLFVARLLSMTTLESFVPARKVSYRSVLFLDIIGFAVLVYLTAPFAGYLRSFIAVKPVVPESILTLPTVVGLFLYYVIGDFGAYWMHRFWHLSPIWRIHKWHHSATSMYWLAGYRASFLQLVLFGLPWGVALSVLGKAPWWVFLIVTVSHILTNDWQHMNVTWRSNWLEWVFITPRLHHVHHSDNLTLSNANFGVIFSIWDRLFGTYVDPETVKEELSFGIGEEVPPLRLVLGV
ncbi:MAG: sterol desaturase family protein [Nitrospira sp. CG24D]|nr:MAG: sterol desaturase family protein [Nitrospira sp. CG24D]